MVDIKLSDINKILIKVTSKTYLKEIIKKTPGSGNVSSAWDIEIKGDNIIIFNEEFGDIITFLESGTKEHIIRARPGHFLKFPKPPHKSKSSKKIPGNFAFEKDGFIFAKAVRHPGIEARHFLMKILNDKTLSDKWDEMFSEELEKLVKKST